MVSHHYAKLQWLPLITQSKTFQPPHGLPPTYVSPAAHSAPATVSSLLFSKQGWHPPTLGNLY